MGRDFSKKDFKPEIEEDILAFWEDNAIFKKSLEKTKSGEPFTFYDGPPFATGLPHYGHILSSTIKDVVGRYQTMKGRYVRRRWGWDCHGLPIEEIVERELGISGKKQIEEIGVAKFNETCRKTVLKYVSEWKKMIRRIARWVDFDNSYKTMDRDYMESVWWAFKQMYEKGLVYEGRKVLLYCPRCETPVSNFEVAMDNSYKDVTEEAVTVKFKVKPGQKIEDWSVPDNTYLLAWTTTPWTLPGNVALAVNPVDKYVFAENPATGEVIVLNEDRYDLLDVDLQYKEGELIKNLKPSRNPYTNVLKKWQGLDFARNEKVGFSGLRYEPLFVVPEVEQSEKSYYVYPANFVTANEGTGIVHTAVVYGEDDYQLGLREGLPVVPLLDERGVFNEKAPELVRGKYFKKANAVIVNDLEVRGLLFTKAAHTHSYPHCWRCETALFYNAIPAWFVNIQKIKPQLLKSNEKEINWFPAHLKLGRYANSVSQAPDWNISRNRYWGNPIPVWKCTSCGENTVVGSIRELGLGTNTFYFARHGEGENNTRDIVSFYPEKEECDLTKQGIAQARKLGHDLQNAGGVDVIVSSDVLRAKHTAEIVGEILGVPVQFDEHLREYNMGIYNGRPSSEFITAFTPEIKWTQAPEGGETWTELQTRMVEVVRNINRKYQGKKILVVTHGDPLLVLGYYFGAERGYAPLATAVPMDVSIVDLHRPAIDEIVLRCAKCGGEARRVKEIFDSWMEAGSMPFAEYHYPFEQKKTFESRLPADFVAEYIAQTRAWFYVMHVTSLALFGKAPFRNVVATGTILAEDGSKMSKSKRNFPDPWAVIEKYGVDSLRFYLMNSVVMQADNLNFGEKDLAIVYRKVVQILTNVLKYFEMYAREASFDKSSKSSKDKLQVLDQWISARSKELVISVTEFLDSYDTVLATRAIENYVSDLSTWYVRRGRGRKDPAFFKTLQDSLRVISVVMAPITPYLSEYIWKSISGEGESVHLENWPEKEHISSNESKILEDMATVRDLASKALALRKSKNIPVKQPLQTLKIKLNAKLGSEILDLLKDEVNVKEIKLGEKIIEEEVEFDVVISNELKIEGLVRSLERTVQDLRKKQGFKVGEMAGLRYFAEDEVIKHAIISINKQKTYLIKIEEDAFASGMKEFELDGQKILLSLTQGK